MQNLTQQQLSHALFYSLKIKDYQHVVKLLQLQPSVNTAYFIQHNKILYTSNMLVGLVAKTIHNYGVSHSKSKLLLSILDKFIELKCDLRCHCSSKHPHYCAISQALRYNQIEFEEDLLFEENILILKLLFHGATYKNLQNSKHYHFIAINTLNSYIATKKDQVIELFKMNRHTKYCANKHLRNQIINPTII